MLSSLVLAAAIISNNANQSYSTSTPFPRQVNLSKSAGSVTTLSNATRTEICLVTSHTRVQRRQQRARHRRYIARGCRKERRKAPRKKYVWRSSTFKLHHLPARKHLHVSTILDPVSCFFVHACNFFSADSTAVLPSDQHIAYGPQPPDVIICSRKIMYVRTT